MVFYEPAAHRWRGKYDEDYSGMGKLCGEDGTTLCLFRGGYLHHLMQTLQMYADMGIKMFKFDFAYFDAATPDAKCTMLPTDIEEQNKNAFISAIKEFRYRNPDVLFIGYNGFGGDMENTVTPFRKTVDLRWLEYLIRCIAVIPAYPMCR